MEEVKQYTIDTNVIRHETNPTGDTTLRKASRIFWKKVKEEMLNGEAVLLIPIEVVRELKIQSFTLGDKENKHISELIELCEEVIPSRLSPEIEHQIREMSAYVRSKFKLDVGSDRMEYGGVSDARILYTAYDEDSVLVTANIKDFLLYPLLFSHEEDRLYNLKENAFVRIPEDGHIKIHSDATFKGMLQNFFKLDKVET